jgi:hypothetical protein
MLKKYKDILTKELFHKLLPKKKANHKIKIIPKEKPQSKVPYQVSIMELMDLKK